MRRSDLAFWLAHRAPRLSAAVLRLWAESYLRRAREEHWLFQSLKVTLGLRVSRRVRLCTGQFLYVDPFEFVGRRIAASGCYEPDTVGLIRRLLAPGMVVVDAGAHVGQYTVIASSLVGPTGQVHAFEPDPQNVAILRRNLRVNQCANVRCHAVALADSVGRATLYRSTVSNAGAGSLRPSAFHDGSMAVVPVRTLSDYATEAGLDRLDLLKADVEGAELLLFKGARELLDRFRPMMVFELSRQASSFDYTRDDLLEELSARGYFLYRIGPPPLPRYEPHLQDGLTVDVLAVHASRLRDVDPGIVLPSEAAHPSRRRP